MSQSDLFEKGLQCVVTRLLHLSVDVSTELGHDVKQSSVMIHQAAAELGSMSSKQPKPGCEKRKDITLQNQFEALVTEGYNPKAQNESKAKEQEVHVKYKHTQGSVMYEV